MLLTIAGTTVHATSRAQYETAQYFQHIHNQKQKYGLPALVRSIVQDASKPVDVRKGIVRYLMSFYPLEVADI